MEPVVSAVPLILKASLPVIIALLVVRFLPRLAAATRAQVLACALAGGLAIPLLGAVLPMWTVSVPLPALAGAPAVAGAPAARLAAAAHPPVPDELRPSLPVVSAPNAAPAIPVGAWILGLWGIGAMVLVLRQLLGVRRFRRTDGEALFSQWRELLDASCRQIGLRSRPELRFAAGVMPTTWGILEPAILLPREAHDWPIERRRGVLLHELAHVRRRDVLQQSVVLLACSLHWFNPLFWKAYRRLLLEREQACDDLVLQAGIEPRAYASDLLETAVQFHARPSAAACMAKPNELENRLMAILDPHRLRSRDKRLAPAVVLLLSLAVLVPLSTVAIGHDAEITISPVSGEARGLIGALRSTDEKAKKVAKQTIARLGDDEIVHEIAADLFDRYASDSELFQEMATFDARSADTHEFELISMLSVPYAVDRAAAAQALSRFPSAATVAALSEALSDPNWHVREWAARSLGSIGDPVVVPDLIEALGDPSVAVREWSARSLGAIGDPAGVFGLALALEDEDSDVREWAARSLGSIGDPDGVPALVAALEDPSDNVREWAVRSLGAFPDRAAAEAVAELLEDPNPEIRQWAMRSMTAMATR